MGGSVKSVKSVRDKISSYIEAEFIKCVSKSHGLIC